MKECTVYWHRTRSDSPYRYWFVDSKGKLFYYVQNRQVRDYVAGEVVWTEIGHVLIKEVKCMHWPTLNAWRRKAALEEKGKPRSKFAGIPFETQTPHSFLREVQVYDWKDVEVRFRAQVPDSLQNTSAELEAADEIEEALTMRIGELREELNKVKQTTAELREANAALILSNGRLRRECEDTHDQVKRFKHRCGHLKDERDLAREFVRDLARAVLGLQQMPSMFMNSALRAVEELARKALAAIGDKP